MPTAVAAETGYVRIREHTDGPYYYGRWKRKVDGKWKNVQRVLGPAWVEPADGSWRPRRGRPRPGHLNEPAAWKLMAEKRDAWDEGFARDEAERASSQDLTIRALAAGWLRWLERVKRAKPSTLADYQYMLAEPGVPSKRGRRKSGGRIMLRFGDKPAELITTDEIDAFLDDLDDANLSPRNVNKHRAVLSAMFNYGVKKRGLKSNPVELTDKRRERKPGAIEFFVPEQVEALARELAAGTPRTVAAIHRASEGRAPKKHARKAPPTKAEIEARLREDLQDAELIRVAFYQGLRLGELLAVCWRDIRFVERTLTVRRALSAGQLVDSTKSGRDRTIPLSDQAAAAFERISRRGEYVAPDDLVFCNRWGRRLDSSAVRRRYKAARDAIGLPALRFHDLRHSFGSNLARGNIDLVAVQTAMGHSDLKTTQRYLHARPAHTMADAFTAAFAPAPEPVHEIAESP